MAFFLNKSTLASHFRSTSQKIESRRQFHVEPRTREKDLLAEDSALKPFKSYKQSVKKLRKIGDVLTIIVVAVTGRVTTKVDVYSYGVILMEMITGRRAIDNSQLDENIHLVTWFRRMQLNKDSFEKIIDPAMDIDEEGLESFRAIAGLAV